MGKRRKNKFVDNSPRLTEDTRIEEDRLQAQQIKIIRNLGTRCKDMKLTIKILSSQNERLKEDNKYLRKYNRTLKETWKEYQGSTIQELINEIELLTIENKNLKIRLGMYGDYKISFIQKLKLLFF